jgi:hypothetical protein
MGLLRPRWRPRRFTPLTAVATMALLLSVVLAVPAAAQAHAPKTNTVVKHTLTNAGQSNTLENRVRIWRRRTPPAPSRVSRSKSLRNRSVQTRTAVSNTAR